MFGLSVWELLIVLAIVVLVFGTARFKNLGSDLGSAIKGFRTAIKDDSADGAVTADGDAAATTDAGASDSTSPSKDDQKANV